MADTEWIALGRVIGDTGPKGDTGVGTIIKGSYDSLAELIAEHPTGNVNDAYLVNGNFYFWNGNQWENAGSLRGDTGDTGPAGPKGDTGDKGDTGAQGDKGDTGETGASGQQGEQGLKGDTGDTGATGDTGPAGATGDTGATGTATTIKGSYDTYQDLIDHHPTGNDGDSYLVNGSLYVWLNNAWENVGSIKGEKGDTGDSGLKGDTGPQGPKGDTGASGAKGDTGASGAQGPKGDTGEGSDEEAGWKLPVNQILTTNTLPTGVSAGYRVAIVTSSVMAIKEYNGSSWDTESLDPYSVIPLKHSGSIQMYLAKSTGPVYMGVEYGVFGKFRFMTQAAYDALSSYDADTIYFVRS